MGKDRVHGNSHLLSNQNAPMQIKLLSLITIPALATLAVAQVNPGIAKTNSTTTAPPVSDALHPDNFKDINGQQVCAGGDLQQIELRDIGGGLYRLAATVTMLNSSTGGAGSFDCVSGVFDPTAGTVTCGNLFAAMNTTGAEFAASITSDGLYCAVDDGSAMGAPALGFRTQTTQPFVKVGPITGGQVSAAYGDSKIFNDPNSSTGYSYAYAEAMSGAIRQADLIVVGANRGSLVTGTDREVIALVPGSQGNHSSEPGFASTGPNVNGPVTHWIHGTTWGAGHSDSYFVPDATSANNPSQRIFDDSTWQANGTLVGSSGTSYWAWSAAAPNNYKSPLDIETVSQLGATFPMASASTINLRTMVPQGSDVYTTVVLLGTAAAPIAIPGTVGNALGSPRPAGQVAIFPLAIATGIAAPGTGGTDLIVNLAPNQILAGIPVPIQGVAVNVSSGEIIIGNTATVIAQ